ASFGDIIELEVTPNLPLTVDNNHVLAWSSDLDYNIEIASGTFGFTTGEGLVNTFRGSGKVLIQTRNIASLASEISKFIPNNSN
ncbi:AIM24 family protein, partial [Sutterella wadsworthensis]|uniref:AIM24 family protein n=1 Tax=Sutterella wadsworthensis TaxID=40545 RepID=UPI0032C0B4D1